MKTNYLPFAAMALMAAFTFQSCKFSCRKGSGILKQETRHINNFTQVSISGAYKVILRQDTAVSVKIVGDDNLLENVNTDVSTNRLTVKTEGNICPTTDYVVYIGFKDLTYLSTSGSVKVASDGTVNTQDITFDMSGSTELDVNLNARNVVTTGSGASMLNLNGQASSHKIRFSGSARVNDFNFIVGKCNIEGSGAGTYKVNVLTDLSVNTSGVCDVRYKGNPENVSRNQSGSGSVLKVN